jgi:subtilisin family serine protease
VLASRTTRTLLATLLAVGAIVGGALLPDAEAQTSREPTLEHPGVGVAPDPGTSGGSGAAESGDDGEVVPDQYVVRLDESIPAADVPAVAQELAEQVGGEVLVDLPLALNGFAIEVDAAGRAELEGAPEVALVADNSINTGDAVTVVPLDPCGDEPDETVAVCGSPLRPEELWNLDRISQRPLPRDLTFSYVEDGSGVDLYVIDSGIRPDNVYFGGRASILGDVHAGPVVAPPALNTEPHPSCNDVETGPTPAETPCQGVNTGGLDCNGHGTHVAGIAGGLVYGVAQDVTIKAVRVLSCLNTATDADVVAGIEMALADADGEDPDLDVDGPTVFNISIAGVVHRGETHETEPVAAAVNTAIDRGAVVVAAAGNTGADACETIPGPYDEDTLPQPTGQTPAFVPRAITVGSSTRTDAFASFSGRGACVDIVAPGSTIWSVSATDDGGGYTDGAFISRKSGTSLAAPAVSGVVAMLLEADPGLGPVQVGEALVDQATTGALTGWLAGTPNRLLYVDGQTFGDVGGSNPFFADVEWMAAEAITTGTAASPKPLYKPSDPVSRQAMSAFMYRLAGSPAFADPASPTFGDVGTGNPFFTEVEWMAAEQIATGTAASPKPLYKPSQPVSRQAMSAFMYRLAGSPPSPDPVEPTFGDVGTGNPFFTEVEWMSAEQIATGTAATPKPLYKPSQPVSRQAMGAFMHRLADGPGVGI